MERIWLNSEDQKVLDPYGRIREKMGQFTGATDRRNPPAPYLSAPPSAIFEAYDKLLRSPVHCAPRHAPYHDYCVEMLSKVGPQGGHYPFAMMEELASRYYAHVEVESPRLVRYAVIGRDYLIRWIRKIRNRVGSPSRIPPVYYDTNAAIPTGLRKGDFRAETEGVAHYQRLFPAMPGQRHMRNAPRLIFQDSTPNVRYVDGILGAARDWLKNYIPKFFASWRNPKDILRPEITKKIMAGCVSIETDYEKMDQHFQPWVAKEIILPIYEAILEEGEYWHLANYVEQMFEQELYMGDYLLSGMHTLFSGVNPTNDFETLLSVSLQCGSLIACSIDPNSEEVYLAALGDDMITLLSGGSRKRADTVLTTLQVAASEVSQVFHTNKCRVGQNDVRFLRTVYYPAARKDVFGDIIGAYPSVLALNNIVQPERISETPGLAAVAVLSRLDGCVGSVDFTQLCDLVRKHTTLRYSYDQLDLTDSSKDWWFRVHGENWNPDSSVSFRYLNGLGLSEI